MQRFNDIRSTDGGWENFYADMGECPKGLSLKRKNNERGLVTYEARSYARAIRRITTVAIVATI